MNIKLLLISAISSLLPIKKNTILFKSFSGQYSDSPRIISECIHKYYPNIHIIWVKSKQCNDEFPKYVETVEDDSAKYHMYSWRASVIVDNKAGLRSAWLFDDTNYYKRILLKYYTRNKHNQLAISTWHGVPLKRIGKDSISFNKNGTLLSNCDYILAGNEHSKDCLQTALDNAIPINMVGVPRTDKIIENRVCVDDIKKKLGIPCEKKVILYAPTFRNDVYSSGVNQMKSIDFNSLLEQLHNKFGGDWCFVFRTHMHVSEQIKKLSLIQENSDLIIDGNRHDDMTDYLLCSDVLLTDYSSSMFDYLFTKRPCFLFVPDLEMYEMKERGFYLELSQLPFPAADSFSGLLNLIDKYDYENYLFDSNSFLLTLGNIENGRSTKEVVKRIITHINNDSLYCN